jgi:uncharacterized protein
MFRLLLRLLFLLVVFAIIRYVVVNVARFLSQAMRPQAPPSHGNQTTAGPGGGELKQDPVCGTFVPTSTSMNKTVNGELVYFCSAACRDKFKVA